MSEDWSCLGIIGHRSVPAAVKKKIAKGQTITGSFSTNLMAMKLKEKREVTILSTFHSDSNEMTMVMTLYCEYKQKPAAVVNYNNHLEQ